MAPGPQPGPGQMMGPRGMQPQPGLIPQQYQLRVRVEIVIPISATAINRQSGMHLQALNGFLCLREWKHALIWQSRIDVLWLKLALTLFGLATLHSLHHGTELKGVRP